MLASTLLAGFLQVAAPAATPDPFMVLFSATCMKHYNSHDQLWTVMKGSGSTELTGDPARFFLSGKPGTAWTVPIDERRYVVALRDDGICAVFAQQAEIEVVRKAFIQLVSKATPPLEALSIPGGPSSGAVQTLTYAWARPADSEQLVFSLTTSINPTTPVQAMASVVLTAK